MDLAIVVLFLILYYLRPQEWSPMFATIHFVQICMFGGIVTLFFGPKGIRPRNLFRTPHDWAVFAFWLWMVVSSPHPWQSFKENANLLIFYIVIVQTLHSVSRMKIFLGWWTILIVMVAGLAVASKLGFDPLDSLDITNGTFKGRLALNLSIFDNPNGLGHAVVPAIPMIYYYCIWNRPLTWRALGIALLTIPLYCIYLTVSKGAFLSGAITIFATMTIGRPKKVQIFMLIVAFMFGSGLLFALPRMDELNKSRADQGIQGRVAAFKHGYQILQTRFAGVGKGNWGQDLFMTDYVKIAIAPKPGQTDDKSRHILRPIRHSKAPHSSYVCTGAELGLPGLFLFVAVLYCCLRTTLSAVTQNSDEERIRRMLFVLVVSYIVSSWMVDFEYRPTFFMFTAAIATLHRHLMGVIGDIEMPNVQLSLEPPVPVWLPQPALSGVPQAGAMARVLLAHEEEIESTPASNATAVATPVARIARNWNRLGIWDGVAISLLTYGVVRFWVYIMAHM